MSSTTGNELSTRMQPKILAKLRKKTFFLSMLYLAWHVIIPAHFGPCPNHDSVGRRCWTDRLERRSDCSLNFRAIRNRTTKLGSENHVAGIIQQRSWFNKSEPYEEFFRAQCVRSNPPIRLRILCVTSGNSGKRRRLENISWS